MEQKIDAAGRAIKGKPLRDGWSSTSFFADFHILKGYQKK